MGTDPVLPTANLLQLNPVDNVLVCCASVESGETIVVKGRQFLSPADIELGHKIACEPIQAGAKVIKYGVPIGSATAPITIGEHVHLHNMKSDYIPSHTRSVVTVTESE